MSTLLPKFCALALVYALCGSVSAGPVNINTADAATLARELKGVGEAKAALIVEYRQKHGAFRSADELGQVKGIGPKLIDRNRADIRVDKVQVAARSNGTQTGTASKK